MRREDDAGDHIFLFMVGDAKPQDAPHADQVAVERLIQALEFATRLRQMQGDFDLVAAGLAPPRANHHLADGLEELPYRSGPRGKDARWRPLCEARRGRSLRDPEGSSAGANGKRG